MKKILFLILVCAAASVASAQDDWKSKNFDDWTKADVSKILNDSAWVKNQEVRMQYGGRPSAVAGAVTPKVAAAGGATSAAGAAISTVNTVNQGGIQPAIDFTFTLRLRSSMAIRLALIKKNQLETDLEKLSKKELELYDQRQVGLYQCPACEQNYVLTLTASSRENRNFDPVFTAFGNAQIEELKKYIYLLNDRGEKRRLVHFTAPKAPGDEAVFFFERLNGKNAPLFTKDSKHLIFNVTRNEVNTAANFKIDIAPIVVGEKVDF